MQNIPNIAATCNAPGGCTLLLGRAATQARSGCQDGNRQQRSQTQRHERSGKTLLAANTTGP
eukprot:135768-Alexandrium_andersonii.AAC.1